MFAVSKIAPKTKPRKRITVLFIFWTIGQFYLTNLILPQVLGSDRSRAAELDTILSWTATPSESLSLTEITNPYSGVKVTLPPDAVAVYDCIKGAELIGNDEHLRKGLDWFITNEPEAYMKLLD